MTSDELNKSLKEAMKEWCSMTNEERYCWPSFQNYLSEYRRYTYGKITKAVLNNE